MSDAYIKRLMVIIIEYSHILNLLDYGDRRDLKIIDDFLERLDILGEENRYALITNIERGWLNRFVKIIKNAADDIKNEIIIEDSISKQRVMLEKFSLNLHMSKK